MTGEYSPFEMRRVAAPEGSTAAEIRVSGEIDLSVVESFTAALDVNHSDEAVLLDMRAVTFMDSSALHALLRALKDLEDSGVRAALVVPRGSVVARLFELTGLGESLPICQTLEEARQRFE